MIPMEGASAKDLDGAVSLERDGLGRWVLGVHIADVSHYVRPGSALDLEAWERGTSVYFADQVVPMLPRELSNGICSLNPRVDRLALSCVMTLTPEGEVVDHTIAKSVIRTTERMTYEDCNALLAHSDPALAERYARILPMLEDMAVVDDDAIQFLAAHQVDKAFISATGIRGTQGLTTTSLFQFAVKRQMIKSAQEIYALLVESKFHATGVNLFADFRELTGIVTSKPVTNSDLLERLEQEHVQVISTDR